MEIKVDTFLFFQFELGKSGVYNEMKESKYEIYIGYPKTLDFPCLFDISREYLSVCACIYVHLCGFADIDRKWVWDFEQLELYIV